MFCDIYNLGKGPVCATELQKVFGINNLQVLEGFMYERIPQEVLEQACGTLGRWKGGDHPKLEITYHHEGSQYWKRLPLKLRRPEIKANGTAAELVPVEKDDPHRRYFPGVRNPMKLRDDPPPPREKPVVRLEDILPDFMKSLNQGSVGPRPQAMQTAPTMPRAVQPPPSVKPVLIEDTVLIEGKPVPLAGGPVVEEPGDASCTGMKGDGSRCGRPATMDGLCGYHARKR